MDRVAYPCAALTLSRRLERAESLANAEFVDARARATPASGACWIEVAGAYAMFDGPASPITQTFGLGLFEPASSEALDRFERFFRERGADVNHEVSPLADAALPAALSDRGYRPTELTSVLYRPLGPDLVLEAPRDTAVRVRLTASGEEPVWADVAARGWLDVAPGLVDFLRDLGGIGPYRTGTRHFLAEIDGEMVAAGALGLHGEVALLGGASTVPEWRNRGAQLALLDARLRYGVDHGCTLAMMAAAPGSASQRNAERQGFRIADTRLKWTQSASSNSVPDRTPDDAGPYSSR
jgi:hypothetical protein